ncbi:MAG: sucrase ferredoxin, partial [Lapillicoccus sp.]
MEWDAATDATVYGTAAPARFWVALEQNGPWGRAAATQSHLPADLGATLEQACASRGGRLSLIRTPGLHPDLAPQTHQVLVAWTGNDAAPAFLLGARVADPVHLLALDVDALARGDEVTVRRSLPDLGPTAPVLLVCTNGRRDVCCAVRGRPVALAGQAAHPGRVWECSHTGGHRFSPTGVVLPWGRTLARLGDDGVGLALAAADSGRLAAELLGPWHDRGSSALTPRQQAAESAVRALLGETDPTALTTSVPTAPATSIPTAPATSVPTAPATSVPTANDVDVTHRDGRGWRVRLSVVEGAARRNSCHDEPVAARTWHAEVTDRQPSSPLA